MIHVTPGKRIGSLILLPWAIFSYGKHEGKREWSLRIGWLIWEIDFYWFGDD